LSQVKSDSNIHKAGTARNHNVLHIGKRLELGAALEDRRVLPDAEVLEKLGVSVSVGYVTMETSVSTAQIGRGALRGRIRARESIPPLVPLPLGCSIVTRILDISVRRC